MRKAVLVFVLLLIVTVAGCIGGSPQTQSSSSTGPTTTPATSKTLSPWKADGVIGENEYPHSLTLAGGKFEVYWRNDGEYIYMALKGETKGWVAIGFEPSYAMKDADMIIGWVQDGRVFIVDAYSTGAYGPHPPDTKLGGTDDILEKAGREEGGYTVIEFKRKLNTGDKYDKVLTPGKEVNFIFAMADTDEFTAKHNIAKGSGKLKLDG